MYDAELINKRPLYFQGDDVLLRFIVRDENGTLVTDFSNIGIKCLVTNYGSETELANDNAGGSDDEISVSDSEIAVYVPSDDTVDYQVGYFTVELQIEDMTESDDIKYYTVYSDRIWFAEESLDF